MSEVQEAVAEQQPTGRLEIANEQEYHEYLNQGNVEEAQEETQESEQPESAAEQPAEQPKEETKAPLTEAFENKAPEAKEEPKEEKVYDPLVELGITEEKDKAYLAKVIEAYKKGEINEFFEKANKDYSKITDTEILKLTIQKEYPTADSEAMDILMERKLNQYGFTGGEDEVADAKALKLIKLDTDKVREELSKEQENYKATAYEQKPTAEQIQAQKDWEDFNNHLDTHNDFAEFGRNKSVSFGDFKAEVPENFDPKLMAKDASAFYQQFYDDKTKSFDAGRFIKATLIANNPDKYAADLIAYGKSLATKELHNELRGVEGGKQQVAPQRSERAKLQIVN